MIIELTGISGSGKSAMVAALREVAPHVLTEPDLLPSWLPAHARNGWGGRVTRSLLSSISSVPTIKAERFAEACRYWAEHAACRTRELRRLQRSIRRKIWTRYCARRSASQQQIVIDEGLAHLAMVLFSRMKYVTQRNLREFGRRLPWPDALVVVTAPAELAWNRVCRRGDPPLPDRTPAERRRALSLGAAIIERIAEQAPASCRVIRLHNGVDDDGSQLILRREAQRFWEQMSAHRPTRIVSARETAHDSAGRWKTGNRAAIGARASL